MKGRTTISQCKLEHSVTPTYSDAIGQSIKGDAVRTKPTAYAVLKRPAFASLKNDLSSLKMERFVSLLFSFLRLWSTFNREYAVRFRIAELIQSKIKHYDK
jgi:hypothetical protein